MKGERLDHVTVTTADPAAAAANFTTLFGLQPSTGPHMLRVGGAEIAFVQPATDGAPVGMTAICVEVDDLDAAATALDRAGIGFRRDSIADRPTLHVDPKAAHGVPLSLVGPR